MFSVHTTPEKFENATITGHFRFVFAENLDMIKVMSSCFRKAPFSKCFPTTLKEEAGVFKSLRYEERFRTAPFS